VEAVYLNAWVDILQEYVVVPLPFYIVVVLVLYCLLDVLIILDFDIVYALIYERARPSSDFNFILLPVYVSPAFFT